MKQTPQAFSFWGAIIENSALHCHHSIHPFLQVFKFFFKKKKKCHFAQHASKLHNLLYTIGHPQVPPQKWRAQPNLMCLSFNPSKAILFSQEETSLKKLLTV